jgi:hypothetical protein
MDRLVSLTRFGGQVVKPLASSVVLFHFVVVVSLWTLWNRRFHSVRQGKLIGDQRV